MKDKKKLISIFLAVLFAVVLIAPGSLPANAEEPQDAAVTSDGGETDEGDPAGGQQDAGGTPAEDTADEEPDEEAPQDVPAENNGDSSASDNETGFKDGENQTDPDPESADENEETPAAAPSADSGIPVLTLTIDPAEFEKVCESEDHSYRATGCSIKIDVPEGYTGDYFGSLDPETVGTELALDYIRGRGNSTWSLDKKPFKFKLDKKKSLLGMDKDKHWILMANYFDVTQMRNRLTSYIATELGLDYMAQYSPVELYVNDEYIGCYMLCHDAEKKVGGDDLAPEDITEPNVTGKYILALEPYTYEHENDKFTTDKGVNFLLKEPTFDPDDDECGQDEQREYITGYLQSVEDAVYGEDFKNADGVRYSDLMDMTSAARYWWVQTFASNNDGFITPSTYLYKLRSDKLYWGPLWDFDMAYSPAMLAEGLNQQRMEWLDYMRAYDPEYQKILRDTWKDFDSVLDDLLKDGGVFDRYAAEVRAASIRDHEKYDPDSNAEEAFDESVATLRELLKGRRDKINSIIDDELTKVYVTVTLKDGDTTVGTVNVRYMDFIPEDAILEGPEKEGYVFNYWATEDGSRFEPLGTAEEDMVLYAVYKSEDEAILPEALYFPVYEIWVNIGEYETYEIPYSVAPKDTDYRKVTWKSSDPGVVSVDANGMMSLISTGTATVTGTLYGGRSASVILHVYDHSETETVPVESVLTESDTLRLSPGEYGQMGLTLKPMPMSFSLEFQSSDEDIATVDPDTGMVHAISPGKCTVTVWEAYSDIYATYTVIVEEKAEPEPAEPEPVEPEPVEPETKEEVFYYYVSGGSPVWTKGSGDALSFVFKRSADDRTTLSHFTGIKIDGKATDSSGYNARSGSVVVEIKPDYLETLPLGRHSLKAEFDDADGVQAGFEIAQAKGSETDDVTPKTGDDSSVFIWIIPVVICAAVIAAVIILMKKRKE